jgi:hypothetical protein
MEEIFTNIYEKKLWGNNKNNEYSGSSGGGSSINYNKNTYIPFLKNFITTKDIKTVVDLGCGDFLCGPSIYDDLDIIYTGYDVYNKIINYNKKIYTLPKYNFIHLDFLNNKDSVLNGDLCILKDVLQHWSFEHIYTLLDYLVETKKYKYIPITNCCNQLNDTLDITDGKWRQLSSNFLPLKKYNATQIYKYNTKEVSLIEIL